MIDPRFVGWRSPPISVEVDKSQLRLFAEATGETDPIYFDETAARAAGHPNVLAPPPFVFCLKLMAGQPFLYAREMGVNIAHLLHGEHHFEHIAPIYARDVITLTTEIVGIEQKKGGALELITALTDAVNQDSVLCARQRGVFVVRHPT
jgi:acyl dehydratase